MRSMERFAAEDELVLWGLAGEVGAQTCGRLTGDIEDRGEKVTSEVGVAVEQRLERGIEQQLVRLAVQVGLETRRGLHAAAGQWSW